MRRLNFVFLIGFVPVSMWKLCLGMVVLTFLAVEIGPWSVTCVVVYDDLIRSLS